MAWRFVRQPNGRLAVFSDVVDDFTWYDMTPEEAVKVAAEEYDMGPRAAKDKVERGLKDEIPWKHGVYGDGTARWLDCLESIEMVHGVKRRRKRERELGSTQITHE